MALFVDLAPDPLSFTGVSAIFIRGGDINARMFDLSRMVSHMMLSEARNRSFATGDPIASLVSKSLYSKVENLNQGHQIEVGSSYQGYPRGSSDLTGNAGEAAQRGWATLAHRLHEGYYPGAPKLSNQYNPAAGVTIPNPFLVSVWDDYARQRGGFINMVAAQVIDPILRTRRV